YFGLGKFLGKFYIDNISLTQIEPATGNNSIDLAENSFSVYPNPTSGNFTVRISEISNNKITKLELLSLEGKLLYQTKLSEVQTEINPGKLIPGFYLVKIISDNSIETKKLLFY